MIRSYIDVQFLTDFKLCVNHFGSILCSMLEKFYCVNLTQSFQTLGKLFVIVCYNVCILMVEEFVLDEEYDVCLNV